MIFSRKKKFTKDQLFVFGEYITRSSKTHLKEDKGELKNSPMRGFFMPLVVILLFGILLFRLVSVQIAQGAYFRDLSDSNRIRTIITHAPRGVIFDRNNEPLVFNVPGYRKVENKKTKLLSRDEALKLIAKGEKGLEIDSLREYPHKDSLSHVLGYIGQISKEELENPSFKNYLVNDLLGKMGIEKYYESKLRGVDGKQLIEVNSFGEKIRTLGQNDPIAGQDITLTIDSKLQEVVYEATKEVKKGAVIVSTPNGEILSLVSRPSFDPNLFTLGTSYKSATDAAYKDISSILLDSDNQPLLNRAIGGVYPPGSTFKLVTAAAGLQDNVFDENYEVEDTGILKVGIYSYANWFYTKNGGKDGQVNVVKAIKRSNDIFFYKAAEEVGVSRLSNYARTFGIGSRLGIDLPGEEEGTVPSPEWKEEVIGEQWYLGDIYHYGIGQGFLLSTPLQVNAWTVAISNGGTLYKPQLLKDGSHQKIRDDFLSDKTIELIRQGMVESCLPPSGVGWPLFNYKVKNSKLKIDGKNFLTPQVATGSALPSKDDVGVSVACKTGTAQHGDEETLPHAWITLYAPAYDPEIVVTVLVESAGEGSNEAGPIAKKILDGWFEKK